MLRPGVYAVQRAVRKEGVAAPQIKPREWLRHDHFLLLFQWVVVIASTQGPGYTSVVIHHLAGAVHCAVF